MVVGHLTENVYVWEAQASPLRAQHGNTETHGSGRREVSPGQAPWPSYFMSSDSGQELRPHHDLPMTSASGLWDRNVLRATPLLGSDSLPWPGPPLRTRGAGLSLP